MEILSLSLFLSLLCCCQCRFKKYIAKYTDSKTEETVPLWSQPAFPKTGLLSFPFSFDVTGYKSYNSFFFLSLFLSFFDFFSLKVITKSVSHLTFRSFFLSFFNIMCTDKEFAQSAMAVEHTNRISARGVRPPKRGSWIRH